LFNVINAKEERAEIYPINPIAIIIGLEAIASSVNYISRLKTRLIEKK